MVSQAFLSPRPRFARHLAGFALALLLAACGGGTDGNAPTQTKPELVLFTGTALSADPALPSGADGLSVKGLTGLARPAQFTAPNVYSVKLDQLTGPWALGLVVASDSTQVIVALGTEPGLVNVTPLTTLVVAQATHQEPGLFFNQLPLLGTGAGPLAGITADRIAQADAQVRQFLAQRYGIVVPAGIASLTTSPFVATAGDPMYDTLVALNRALAAKGQTVITLGKELAVHALLCDTEHLDLASAAGPGDFCPASKLTKPDQADAALLHYLFSGDDGAVLQVDARGTNVLSVSLVDATGATFACGGTACAGLALGAPVADQSRPVALHAVTLAGASGSVVLDGTLTSATPEIGLPPLPCDINFYGVIYADDTVAASCAAPDALGYGAGETHFLGQTRRAYLFTTDGSVDPPPPSIEVIADGQTVVSVLVYDEDPDTGAKRPLYRCTRPACNGVTIGSPVDDTENFPPYTIRVRPVSLDDTLLPAIGADGTPSVTVRATLISAEYDLAPLHDTAPCASDAQRVVQTVTGEPTGYDLCPPAELQGLDETLFVRSGLDNDGHLLFHIGSLIESFGSTSVGPGLDVTVDGTTVLSAFLLAPLDAQFTCTGAACAGITVTAPDAMGQRTLTFSGAVLGELEMTGLPGDRTSTLQGSFVAPALPPQ